jgi:hypothetical protein
VILLASVVVVAIVGIATTIRAVVTDGYRRVPTR